MPLILQPFFQRLLQSDGLRAMRHRNFRIFLFGQLISVIGSWMQSTAQQWLVYKITGSLLKLGLVSFIGLLPVLLFSLFMGVLVDRMERRHLLIFTQAWFMLLAIILAALTFTGLVEFWHILLLAFLLGAGKALDMPARQAFYVDLVERDDLMNAIALNSTIFNGARIIGPAVAGIVVATLGEAPAFAINAVSYLAVIAGLLLIHSPHPKTRFRRTSGLEELKQSFRYLLSHKEVIGLVTMIALYSVLGFPYLVLLPAFAVEILNMGADGFGILIAAQGIGALIGAVSIAAWGSRLPKGKLLDFSRIGIGFAIAGLGWAKTPFQASLALAGAGFCFILMLALTNTLIQLLVPDELRGRILSTYTWALGGFFPLGSLLLGSIGELIGLSNILLISAACCVLLYGLARVWISDTRQMN